MRSLRPSPIGDRRGAARLRPGVDEARLGSEAPGDSGAGVQALAERERGDLWGFDAPPPAFRPAERKEDALAPARGRRPQELLLAATSARSRVSAPKSGGARPRSAKLAEIDQWVSELDAHDATPSALLALTTRVSQEFSTEAPSARLVAVLSRALDAGLDHLRLRAALAPDEVPAIASALSSFADKWQLPLTPTQLAEAEANPDIKGALRMARARLGALEVLPAHRIEDGMFLLLGLREAHPDLVAALPDLDAIERGLQIRELEERPLDGVEDLEQFPVPPEETHPELEGPVEDARRRLATRAELFLARGAPVSGVLRDTLEAWGIDVDRAARLVPRTNGAELPLEGLHPRVARSAKWLVADVARAAKLAEGPEAQMELSRLVSQLRKLLVSDSFSVRSPEQQIWWINSLRPEEVPGTDRSLEPPLVKLDSDELGGVLVELLQRPPGLAPPEEGLDAAVGRAADRLLAAELAASGGALSAVLEVLEHPIMALTVLDRVKGVLHRASGADGLEELRDYAGVAGYDSELEAMQADLASRGRPELGRVLEHCARRLKDPAELPPVAPLELASGAPQSLERTLEAGRSFLGPTLRAASSKYRELNQARRRGGPAVPKAMGEGLTHALEGKKEELLARWGLDETTTLMLAHGSAVEGGHAENAWNLRDALVELIRLTNGRAQAGVASVTTHAPSGTAGRACFTTEEREIYLPHNSKRVLFHEYGHALESSEAETLKVSHRWVESRRMGDKTYPLSDLLVLDNLAGRLEHHGVYDSHETLVEAWRSAGAPSLDTHEALQAALAALPFAESIQHAMANAQLDALRPYAASERAYPMRGVSSPYAGKVYETGATEVVSMGLEAMTDGPTMLSFATEAPEHFELIVGILAR